MSCDYGVTFTVRHDSLIRGHGVCTGGVPNLTPKVIKQLSIDFGLGVLKDQEYELSTLRLGQLMREAGFAVADADPDRNFSGVLSWFGSLSEVEKCCEQHARRRAEAQSMRDEALMDDDERAKPAAENNAHCDALDALPQRKTRGDGSQYDRYPDGRVVEVTT